MALLRECLRELRLRNGEWDGAWEDTTAHEPDAGHTDTAACDRKPPPIAIAQRHGEHPFRSFTMEVDPP